MRDECQSGCEAPSRGAEGVGHRKPVEADAHRAQHAIDEGGDGQKAPRDRIDQQREELPQSGLPERPLRDNRASFLPFLSTNVRYERTPTITTTTMQSRKRRAIEGAYHSANYSTRPAYFSAEDPVHVRIQHHDPAKPYEPVANGMTETIIGIISDVRTYKSSSLFKFL